MDAVVCYEVFLEDSSFTDGFPNKRFFNAVVKKNNDLFFPAANKQRNLSIGIDIVQSSIYLTNKIIDQYQQMFEPSKREIKQVPIMIKILTIIINRLFSFLFSRLELSLVNSTTLVEQKQTGMKRKHADIIHDETYLDDEVETTSIKTHRKKLTNKLVRENQVAAKAVSKFDPTSDDGIKIIKLILSINAAVLTKSAWSRHPTLKNYIPLLVPAIEHLIDLELLILFDRGAIVTSNEHRLIPVYVKKMIPPSAAKENMSLSKLLTLFKVEHSDYIATWSNVNLPPTVSLTDEVYNFLNDAPYSIFLRYCMGQWAPKSRRRSSCII
ncbi:unnamed protein product, partial [Rotaria sp. Silwood2]